MEILNPNTVKNLFTTHRETSLFGKWIRHQDILPSLERLPSTLQLSEVGRSVEGRSISTVTFGNGPKRIFIWSQMHGNESTGTKALFDLLNLLNSDSEISKVIASKCRLIFLPMLNPDGAERYTRVNANEVDLNRDAVDLSQVESKILRKVLADVHPQFCFNLHDQRTIFGVEGTTNPATLSFLAPSEEVTKKLTNGRKETMNVIVAMNALVQQIIPNHIGRYTDEFYPTATGDNFQKLGYNTILIESGHYPEDYVREKSREFTFYALLQGIYHIATADSFFDYEAYFSIPNNDKLFLDVIHRYQNGKNIGYLYKDKILKNRLVSHLVKEEDYDISNKMGHMEIVFEAK